MIEKNITIILRLLKIAIVFHLVVMTLQFSVFLDFYQSLEAQDLFIYLGIPIIVHSIVFCGLIVSYIVAKKYSKNSINKDRF